MTDLMNLNNPHTDSAGFHNTGVVGPALDFLHKHTSDAGHGSGHASGDLGIWYNPNKPGEPGCIVHGGSSHHHGTTSSGHVGPGSTFEPHGSGWMPGQSVPHGSIHHHGFHEPSRDDILHTLPHGKDHGPIFYDRHNDNHSNNNHLPTDQSSNHQTPVPHADNATGNAVVHHDNAHATKTVTTDARGNVAERVDRDDGSWTITHRNSHGNIIGIDDSVNGSHWMGLNVPSHMRPNAVDIF